MLCTVGLPSIQQQRLFPFTRAGGRPGHTPIPRVQGFAQYAARHDLVDVRCDVELQVARHAHTRHTERAIAIGIIRRLRQHGGQLCIRLACGIAQARCTPMTARRQTPVDEHHRHAGGVGTLDQHRPDLRLHQQAETRLEVAQEPVDGTRQVIRQIRLDDAAIALRGKLGARAAAGRRHVREQHGMVRKAREQRIDERLRGTRLTNRHGMHPQQRAIWICARGVEPEPLANVLAIAGLLATTPPQAQQCDRQRNAPQQAIQEAQHQSTPSARSASSAWALVGWASALPRSCTLGVQYPPVRHEVVKL